MAMSTPTVTNISTANFRAIHPSGDMDPNTTPKIRNDGSSGAHHVSHVGYINNQAAGRAILTYCAEDNALNIDLIS